MTAGGCAEARISLGAYVLGALEPAERGRVDAHLAMCGGCRDELASFAALPGLLGRASIAEVELTREPGTPPLLSRLLDAVARERRRERRTRRLGVAAAAAIVVAAGSVAGVAVSSQGSGTAAAATFAATDPTTNITASVAEWPKAWGSALEVQVSGLGPGGSYGNYGAHVDRCRLVVVKADGSTDVAASWSATSSAQIVAHGATAFAASDITAFDVMSVDGKMLVRIPANDSAGNAVH